MTSSTPAIDRFHGKYTVNPATKCHEWTGSISSQAGYPTIGIGRSKPEYAYRVAWTAANGPMPTTPPPDGSWRWELHHDCENKRCVNADHVVLLTNKQHAARHKALRAARAAQSMLEAA